MVKLEYSRYNAVIKYKWFPTILKVVIYFLILTEVMIFSVEFCVVKFSSFG